MKTSIKVFLLLIILCVTGLAIANYKLQQQYVKIDQTDPYQAFDKIEVDEFKYIHITGGNSKLIEIETGLENSSYIDKRYASQVELSTSNDTLYVIFDEGLSEGYSEDIRYNERPCVTVKSVECISIYGTNAAMRVNLLGSLDTQIKLDEVSTAEITNAKAISQLDLTISGTTFLYLNASSEIGNIDLLKLSIIENGRVNLSEARIDSVNLQMLNESQLTAGADFFRK